MRRTIVFLAIAATLMAPPRLTQGFPQKSVWNKTEAIEQLPFCALRLRILESQFGREVYILMDPDEVTESNLRLLFRVISEKNPEPLLLETFVSTNVQQLKSLVTNMNTSAEELETDGSDVAGPAQRMTEKHKGAYYKRTDQVELFRYNPTFPKIGMKTIVLRGKE